jgi:threonine dehydratase
VTVDDIRQAHELIAGDIVQTPLLNNPVLDRLLGCDCWVKGENLQRTGAFKVRGAFHFLRQLGAKHIRRGVIAYSSGNHAQALAYAASQLGVRATIVMPHDAPVVKVKATQGYGATVVFYQRPEESREAVAQKIIDQTGAILVPPFDHPWTVLGQGTLGLEAASQWRAENHEPPDVALVPCSGGGLSSGTFIALKDVFPDMTPILLEPTDLDDMGRSLVQGKRVVIEPPPGALCDSLTVPTPGAVPFQLCHPMGVQSLVVPDSWVRHAMAVAFKHLKLVLEPGGAIGLGALLMDRASGQPRFSHQRVLVVASGGNVDPTLFAEILAAEAPSIRD